jgi:hypothetical protein
MMVQEVMDKWRGIRAMIVAQSLSGFHICGHKKPFNFDGVAAASLKLLTPKEWE